MIFLLACLNFRGFLAIFQLSFDGAAGEPGHFAFEQVFLKAKACLSGTPLAASCSRPGLGRSSEVSPCKQWRQPEQVSSPRLDQVVGGCFSACLFSEVFKRGFSRMIKGSHGSFAKCYRARVVAASHVPWPGRRWACGKLLRKRGRSFSVAFLLWNWTAALHGAAMSARTAFPCFENTS